MTGISTKVGTAETFVNSAVGSMVGQTTSDPIGFYGAAAQVGQRSNQNQALIPTAGSGATLYAVNTTTVTPTAVAASTVAAQTLTVTGAPTNSSDFVIFNKIAAQAGLGLAGARAGVTAATIVANYCNPSAATVTPTVAEAYLVAALRNMALAITLSPAVVPALSTPEQIFSGFTGVAPGMIVHVIKPTDQAGLGIVGCRVAGNGQVGITFINDTVTAITPTAAESYSYVALAGLSAQEATVVLGANYINTTTPTASILTELALTVTGAVLADDTVSGVSKPSTQTGIAVVGARVSAASVLGLSWLATATPQLPTQNEIYQITLSRKAPVAPLTLYSVTLTPAAVGPVTTAEQGFTVTGLVASQLVLVNKSSPEASIGLAGARVSAANVLGITFSNTSAVTVTPQPQTYLVGQFQLFPPSGSYLAQTVLPADNAQTNLVDELRTTLVGLNMIGGA